MSDEREMRLEHDDEETEDVEGHMRLKNDLPDVRLADDDDGDDVEAHQRLAPKTDVP
jgi:hypothetical protein